MRNICKWELALALALMSLATPTAACSDDARSSRADAEATAKETVSSRPRSSSRRARYRPVRFAAADGVELVGRLSGSGAVAVILAHGFSQGTAQEGWLRFVPALVGRGPEVTAAPAATSRPDVLVVPEDVRRVLLALQRKIARFRRSVDTAKFLEVVPAEIATS